MESTVNIEFALNFKTGLEDTQEINIVHQTTLPQGTETSNQLQDSLEQIVKWLEALEKVNQPSTRPRWYYTSNLQRRDSFNHEANPRCWTCGELVQTLSFKLQWASQAGGGLAETLTCIHRPYNTTSFPVNAIFYVQGHINTTPINFLLDSDAAMCIVHYQLIPDHFKISNISIAAVGANGGPLDVMGWVTLSVSLGSFSTQQEFVIVRNLTVNCLLGADFLQAYNAVIDCGNAVIQLSNNQHHTIPITLGKPSLQQEVGTKNESIVRSST